MENPPGVNPRNKQLCFPEFTEEADHARAKAVAYPKSFHQIPIEWTPMRPMSPIPPDSPSELDISEPKRLPQSGSISPKTSINTERADRSDSFEMLPRPALKRFPSHSYRPSPMIRAISEPYTKTAQPAVITEAEWFAALQEQRRMMMQLENYRVRFESISAQTQETPKELPQAKGKSLRGFRAAKAKTLAFVKHALKRFTSPKSSDAA